MQVIVCALLLSVLSSPPPAADIGKAARQVLADGDYQTALPGQDAPAEPPSARTGPPPTRSRPPTLSPAIHTIAKILLWTLAAAVVLAILWWVVSELRAPGRLTADPTPEPGRPDDGAAPSTLGLRLGDAESLAAAGRFDEAIHVLLLDSLGELERRRRAPLEPSLTSREIVVATQAARFPVPAVEALGGLVRTVEVSLFGGMATSRDDYERCLSSFHRFVEACRGAA